MILVVFYHCLCGYSHIWGENYSWQTVPFWSAISHILVYIHMPIFTLMSAYLYSYLDSLQKYEQAKDFVLKKIKRLLIPYIIWGIITCFIQKIDFEYLLFGVSHLWYLMFLFEAFITFHIINRIPHKSKFILLISLYLASLVINKLYPTPFLGLGYFVRYMPYFVIGYYLYYIVDKVNIKGKYLSMIAFASFFILILEYIIYNNKFILAGVGLVAVISIIMLCKQNENLLASHKNFLKLEPYLMGVYLIHHILIQEMNGSIIGQLYMNHYIIYPLLLFIISFGISLAITYILKKSKYGKIILGA